MGWLLVKSLGLPRWLWGALALVGLSLAHMWLVHGVTKDAKEDGRTIEREATQTIVLDNVSKANEAREDFRSGGDPARYAECLRSARNPENCQRFLPN